MNFKRNKNVIFSSIFAVIGFFVLSIIFNSLGIYFGYQAKREGKSSIPLYINIFFLILYIVGLIANQVYF